MAASKKEGSFGLDPALIAALDWNVAIKRVFHDLRSDFVWAPHTRFIFQHAGVELSGQVRTDLANGTFNPGVPLTIEVPKSFRIRVGGRSKRLGPNFSRPGSVLSPPDRLFYQILANEAAEIVDKKTDHTRSFSHRLSEGDSDTMFVSTRKCWSELQAKLKSYIANPNLNYILRLDVADYFGSINQHTLVNNLRGHGYNNSLAERLESVLLSFTGRRSSRGILQGIYPSDLFGAFYMHPIDRLFADLNITSARFVDDLYVFVDSVESADIILRTLIQHLRAYDLNLNEAKSTIIPKGSLFTEEPDLETLFSQAVEEISAQLEDSDADVDYGFQKEWEEDGGAVHEDEGPDLELQATKALFSSIDDFPGHEESIERFCLPLLTKAASESAIDHVVDALKRRPSMTQIYAAYLGKFVDGDAALQSTLLRLLKDRSLYDWQKMWILAALSQVGSAEDESVRVAMTLLSDGGRHDALRAVAAIYVGRFGDHARRNALFATYGQVSEYVRLAIYYSSRFWPVVERKNARSAWGGHGPMHKLMSIGLGVT